MAYQLFKHLSSLFYRVSTDELEQLYLSMGDRLGST